MVVNLGLVIEKTDTGYSGHVVGIDPDLVIATGATVNECVARAEHSLEELIAYKIEAGESIENFYQTPVVQIQARIP